MATGNFTDTMETYILAWLKGTIAVNPPTKLSIALYTANTNLEDGVPPSNEVSGGGYARQHINLIFGVNDVDIIWDPATTNWGTVTHFVIWGTIGGMEDPLIWGEFNSPITVNAGNIFKINAHDLTVEFH